MSSIGTIITKYRKNAHMSQIDLSEALNKAGFATNNKVISKWENDAAKPSVDVFLGICRLLGVRNIYEEFYGSDPADPLSELNDEGKEKAFDYIRLLIDSGRYSKSEVAEVIEFPQRQIRLFDLPVSAGTGEFLDSDNYTLLDVDHPIPKGTDFALRISGNSMEPMFVTNQIVWVHRQHTLENEEIGVFYLDGKAYCKKLQKDENGTFLVSLNKAYKPIAVTENSSYKIFGKIIQGI